MVGVLVRPQSDPPTPIRQGRHFAKVASQDIFFSSRTELPAAFFDDRRNCQTSTATPAEPARPSAWRSNAKRPPDAARFFPHKVRRSTGEIANPATRR
jgi:hypothetical protein